MMQPITVFSYQQPMGEMMMKKWKCSVCGYTHTGDEAPGKCPVCGVGADKFAPSDDATMTLKEYTDAQINGEAWEVVHYHAAAMLAEKLGLPQIATVIHQIAEEEAVHGANYAFRSGAVGRDTAALKEFIAKMVEAEKGAHKMKSEGASLAKAEGDDEMAGLFKTSAEDEMRHAQMWDWCLKQL
jgi:rubrerythrin